MTQPSSNAVGKATTTKKLFSRCTQVESLIEAAPSVVWALLVDASKYPEWNSTILSLEGKIALGETIRLKSTLAPSRVFKLKVKEFQPPAHMVWGDAMGRRVYHLTEQGSGKVRFTMSETIGGPLFPLFARLIPPFDAAFEKFAIDLKTAAEAAR